MLRLKYLTVALFACCVASTAPVSSAFADKDSFKAANPQACGNCHYKPQGPKITPSFSKASADLNETLTLTIKLEPVNAGAKMTGFWVSNDGQGKFVLIDPAATRLHATGVTHAAPKSVSGGSAEFTLKWTSPATKGVSDFTIFAVTSNSNGSSDDDHTSSAPTSIAFGCAAKTYYPDVDKDGFGNKKQAKLSCDPVPDFILKGEDCNDEKADINPDAKDVCNNEDDNCDGETDEGLDPGIYYKDEDGDGHAANGTKPEYTCKTEPNFAATRGDCAPKDADIYPGAKEVKNGKDDDCDDKTDEDLDESEPSGGCTIGGSRTTSGLTVGLFLGLVALGLARSVKRNRARS